MNLVNSLLFSGNFGPVNTRVLALKYYICDILVILRFTNFLFFDANLIINCIHETDTGLACNTGQTLAKRVKPPIREG